MVDSAGTIELSEAEALNAFVTLKSDADLPIRLFMLRLSRESQRVRSQILFQQTLVNFRLVLK